MSEMVYQVRPGARLPVAAEVVEERLEFLERALGKVTVSAVIDDARPDTAPLHSCFTWDVAKAAAERLEEQARYLLRAVVRVCVRPGQEHMPEEQQEKVMTRAWVSVQPEGEERVFRSVSFVLQQPDLKAQMMSQARAELAAFRRKYAMLTEFAELMTVIDDALAVAV